MLDVEDEEARRFACRGLHPAPRVGVCARACVRVCERGVHEFPSHQRDDVRQLCRCHCTHAGARAKLRMCVHMDPCMYLRRHACVRVCLYARTCTYVLK